jgi:hypothetical protein
VGTVKIPYYVVKRNGRGFWQPTKAMKALGFASLPCGPDGPDAWRKAQIAYQAWLASMRGSSPQGQSYPSGSVGEAWERFRRTSEWIAKAPRTREEWDRAWRWIEPVFGDVAPRTISMEDVSGLRELVKAKVSLREAHRIIKIWRAFWRMMAAMQYCVRDEDPSLGLRNRAAKGRSETWAEGEVARLFKRAWRMSFHGLAAVIAVAWDSQLSPGDIRSLTASQVSRSPSGALFFTSRAKTGSPVGGALSNRVMAAIAAYLDQTGIEPIGDAVIFRNRSGTPYTSDTLGDDFRDVRTAEFGPMEKRRLGHDFRRSGAVEAIVGEAKVEALAHAMGNTLATSNSLFATYVPTNLATIRAVLEARRRGRTILRGNR